MEGMSRKDMEAKVIARAWADEDFRKELIADPKGTAEKVFGQKMPESLTIQVHVEDLSNVHLVLPMKPEQSGVELSLDELEQVAGGNFSDCCNAYSAECW